MSWGGQAGASRVLTSPKPQHCSGPSGRHCSFTCSPMGLPGSQSGRPKCPVSEGSGKACSQTLGVPAACAPIFHRSSRSHRGGAPHPHPSPHLHTSRQVAGVALGTKSRSCSNHVCPANRAKSGSPDLRKLAGDGVTLTGYCLQQGPQAFVPATQGTPCHCLSTWPLCSRLKCLVWQQRSPSWG